MRSYSVLASARGALVLGLSLTACQTEPGAEADGEAESNGSSESGEAELVTYHGEIRAVIEQKCLGCHVPGAIGPLRLTNWAEVEPFAQLIADSVEDRVMPPWLPDESCRATRDSQGLTLAQQALFAQWEGDGLLEGDPADYVAPEPDPADELGEPDLVLTMPEPYAPTLIDDYRCLPVSEPFEQDVFIKAIDILPDNKDLVHHTIVYLAGQNALDELDELDGAEPGPGYACFGGPGISIPDIAGMWAPGFSAPLQTPEGSAVRIPAGSRMILQMHYNTLNAGGANASDQSSVQLWTLDPGEVPERVINFVLFSNKTFEIPPGESDYLVETDMGFPTSGTLVGMAPHMHTLGTSMSAELPGTNACVIDVPRWDFNWQGMFYFDESEWTEVEYGDTLRTDCNYDNSAANQPIVDGEQIEPTTVGYGDGTRDEMCVFYAIMSQPYSPGAEGMCGPADSCIETCGPDDVGCFLSCIKTAGTACFACALQEISACAPQFCVDQILPLLTCIDNDCPTETDTCLPLQCAEPFEAAWDCLAPHVFAGDCDANLSDCGLIVGD